MENLRKEGGGSEIVATKRHISKAQTNVRTKKSKLKLYYRIRIAHTNCVTNNDIHFCFFIYVP